MSIDILESQAVRHAATAMTVEQFHVLNEAGALAENVELIEGVLIKKMTKSPKHSNTVRRLQAFFNRHLPAELFLNVEQPLTLANSEPEPDLALIQGQLDDFENQHPQTAQLVIEVSMTSLELDREMGAMYARAMVPEYWIVNLADSVLEVYSQPLEDGYRTRTLYRAKDTIEVLAIGKKLSLEKIL